MEKGIKFHSIYYRYFIFILMFVLSTFYVIAYHEVGNDMVEVSFGEFKISMSPYQYTYRGFVALIVISIFCILQSGSFRSENRAYTSKR